VIELQNLPAFLASSPPANVADPDGAIEQVVHALMAAGDLASAFRQSCAIRNHYRREVWFHRLQHESIKRLQQA
jgi:hypothetical protein